MSTSRANTARDLMLVCGSIFTIMGGMVVAPGMASMARHFADTPNSELAVRLVLTIPALAVAISSFSMGSLVDRFGRRPVLLLSTIGFGITGSAGYFIDSLLVLLISRVLLGFCIAGLMTAVTTIVGDVYQGRERQAFLGWQTMAMNGGGVLFVGVSGFLANISWRFPFWLYSAAFALVVGFFFFITETGGRKHRNAQRSASDSETDSPPPKRASIFALAPIFLAVALLSSVFYITPVQLAFVFEALDLSVAKVGLGLAVMSLCSALASAGFSTLTNKLGNVLSVTWIVGNLGLGYLIIGHATTFAGILAGLLITGLGLGVYVPLSISLGMAAVHRHHLGMATGAITSALFFGQFVAPFVAMSLLGYASLQGTFTLIGKGAMVVALGIVLFKIYLTTRRPMPGG